MRTDFAVAGAGYVGLAMSALLAQRYRVVCCDIDPARIAMLQAGTSPIQDRDITAFLASGTLDLTFTVDPVAAYSEADTVIVATPTDYDAVTGRFDTGSVAQVVADAITLSRDSTIVIKSTIPVGYTHSLAEQYHTDRVLFCPEFLREGRALHDNLHPSRIVVGGSGSARAVAFAEALRNLAMDADVPTLHMSNTEAESVKLFSNTYLAMRVAFFNELDSFAIAHRLDAKNLIDAVCLDPRIGGNYNNPSFGYGGYCLPKDTLQLLGNFGSIPQALISGVVDANAHRMDFVTDDIIDRDPHTVGVYRLAMKAKSDNFRESSVFGVMERLAARGVKVIVHEPIVDEAEYRGFPLIADFDQFVTESDVIIANRMAPELAPHRDRVYSRDIYGVN